MSEQGEDLKAIDTVLERAGFSTRQRWVSYGGKFEVLICDSDNIKVRFDGDGEECNPPYRLTFRSVAYLKAWITHMQHHSVEDFDAHWDKI